MEQQVLFCHSEVEKRLLLIHRRELGVEWNNLPCTSSCAFSAQSLAACSTVWKEKQKQKVEIWYFRKKWAAKEFQNVLWLSERKLLVLMAGKGLGECRQNLPVKLSGLYKPEDGAAHCSVYITCVFVYIN